MINKKYLKNLRCKEMNNKNDFIFDLYSERIIDSLDLVSINFKNILLLGNYCTKIIKYIEKRYKYSQLTIIDYKKFFNNNANFNFLSKTCNDLDLLKLDIDKYDLIISNFFLSFSDDLNDSFKKILLSLKSNGFLVATLPSIKNFDSLKSAMIKTDLQFYGGAYNRFIKGVNLQKIIEILKKNNYKIPLVNTEKINLEYKQFFTLLHDLKSMKFSYFYKDKKNTFEKKMYFKQLEKNFTKNYNNNFELTSNFYLISGWKEHKSQQKPLKPGEAKNKLQDFL